MSDLIRDSPFGQLVRYITHNQLLRYPEELPDFALPTCYCESDSNNSQIGPETASLAAPSPLNDEKFDLEKGDDGENDRNNDFTRLHLARTLTDTSRSNASRTITKKSSLAPVSSRVALERAATRGELEQAFSDSVNAAHDASIPIEAEKLDDGTILVDFYSTDDPANPQVGSDLIFTIFRQC